MRGFAVARAEQPYLRQASTSHAPATQHGHTEPAHGHGHGHDAHEYVPSYRERIGKREVVGYGWNGEPDYIDSKTWPYPAIRWMEPTPEIDALREKEKGDWRELTLNEKKTLYRASFRETYAEMDAPTGDWKLILGGFLTLVSVGLWGSILIRKTMPPLPISMSDEARLAQLQRMIGYGVGHVDGLSSWWDYEKGQWKE